MKSHVSMSRTYRLVWSQSLGVMVAGAENAKGRGKSSTSCELIAGAGFEEAPYRRTVFLLTKSEGIFMNHFESKKRQLGQGMTEYIIIVALIAVAAIGVYSFFGETIRAQMAGMTNEMAGKDGSANIQKAGEAADKATAENNKAKNLGNYAGSQK